MTRATTPMRRVAIVGGGISGLTTACELAERGIPFVIFEAGDEVGGVWCQKAYRECFLITSRKSTNLAGVEQPESYPDFPSGAQFHAYIRQYAESKGLIEHVRFHARVERATPEDGGWTVQTADGRAERFSHVVACTGLNHVPFFPTVPGERTGDILHSGDYRSAEDLTGKRVLVVGGGNSACDIAVEAGRVATSSDLSMRNGRWIVPKYAMGIPITDMQGPAPFWAQRKFLQFVTFMHTGRLSRFGLPEPDHRLFDQPIVMSQQLPYMLKHGLINVRPGVERFDGMDVVFTDGARGTYDLVVMATGFRPDLSFVDEQLQPHGSMGPTNHRWLFCREHPTLFLNGYYLNNGAFTQVANVAAKVIAACIEHPDASSALLQRDMQRNPKQIHDGFVIQDRKKHIQTLESMLKRLA